MPETSTTTNGTMSGNINVNDYLELVGNAQYGTSNNGWVKDEGIYTVEKQDIINFIKEKNFKTIHNLDGTLSSIGILTGCDWEVESVIDYIIKGEHIAVMTPEMSKRNLNHALSVVRDGRPSVFDIGEIKEEYLEVENQPENFDKEKARDDAIKNILKEFDGKKLSIDGLRESVNKIFGSKVEDLIFKFSIIEMEYIHLMMEINGIEDTDENYEDIFMKLKLFEKLVVKKYRGEIK